MGVNPSDLYAKGSESFRRLNPGLADKVPRGPGTKAAKNRDLDAAVPVPKPKPDLREPLVSPAPTEAGRASGTPRRVLVQFTLYRVRLLDPDNKYASVKLILDAIRHAGLIHDDNERVIDLNVRQYKVGSYAQEGTGVVITYE